MLKARAVEPASAFWHSASALCLCKIILVYESYLVLSVLISSPGLKTKHKGESRSRYRLLGSEACRVQRQLHSWDSQVDLAEGLETSESLSSSSPARSGIRSTFCGFFHLGEGPQLHLSSSKGVDVVSVDEDSPPQSPQYEELLEVVTRGVVPCCMSIH